MTPNQRFARALAAAVRPDPKTRISEWAAANRVLPPDVPEPGPWRNERTPYLVDIMDTMSPGSPYREGWVKKGVQVGGSACGENFIGAAICTAAGSILMVFATLDDAKQWELSRFTEMRDNTRELRRRVKDPRTTGSDNTKLRKKYPGGVLRLVGANRAGAVKSATIRYVKFEEPDEYVTDLDDQGNPIALAMKRTSNFGSKAKIYGDGTPTIKGRSAIDQHYHRGDQRLWMVPCPECSQHQALDWKRFKWEPGQPDTVLFHCEACGVGSPEHAWKSRSYARRPGMTEAEANAEGLAHWQATAQGERGVASWHLPSLMAPIGWRPWSALAAEWDAAIEAEKAGDPEAKKEFVNNQLGDVWAESMNSEMTATGIAARREQYAQMTCPTAGLVLVAGVDTQDNRLEVEIRAYGRGEESWGVQHSVLYGSPSSPETWGKLRELLETPVQHESGQLMRIDAAAIDAGGHHDADVKMFCRDAQARGRHWFAIRGATTYHAPMLGKPRNEQINWRGKPIPGAAVVRYVGTQSIKNLLYSRLAKVEKPGPGYVHFPIGYEEDYFAQLVAERRELRKDRNGNRAYWWVKTQARNEAWDLMVYGYSAFLYAMGGRHAERVWRDRETVYGAHRQGDLLTAAVPAREAPDAAVAVPTIRQRRVISHGVRA